MLYICKIFNYYVLFIGSGMITMVHDNAQAPSIELAGMLLAPGRYHKLSYTKKD